MSTSRMSAPFSVSTWVALNSIPGRSSTVTEIAWFAMGDGILSGYHQLHATLRHADVAPARFTRRLRRAGTRFRRDLRTLEERARRGLEILDGRVPGARDGDWLPRAQRAVDRLLADRHRGAGRL